MTSLSKKKSSDQSTHTQAEKSRSEDLPAAIRSPVYGAEPSRLLSESAPRRRRDSSRFNC